MKKINDRLKRKVLCGLLAVVALGACGNVDAAYAVTNYSSSTTSSKDVSVVVSKNNSQRHQTGLQFYHASKKSGVDVNVRLKGNIDANVSNTATDNYSITSAVYAYAGTADASHRVNAYLGSEGTDHVNLTASGGNHVMGIYMVNSGGNTAVNGAYMEVNGENLTIDATTTSDTGYVHGIYVGNNTTSLNGKKSTQLVINSENTVINAHSSVKEHEIGIATYSQGEVEVNGNLEINAANAIVTRGNSKITINKNGDKTVKINGDVVFDYDAASSGTTADADLTLNLSGEDSSFTGRTYVNGNPPAGKAEVDGLEVDISDGASWNVTGDSFVNNANVSDGGAINVSKDVDTFDADKVNLTGGAFNAEGGTTTISTLNASGDSTVNLTNANLNVAGGTADIAEFNASGTSTLTLAGNDTKMTIEGGDATLSSITTRDSSSLTVGSGASVTTDTLTAGGSSAIVAASGSELHATTVTAGDSSTFTAESGSTVTAETYNVAGDASFVVEENADVKGNLLLGNTTDTSKVKIGGSFGGKLLNSSGTALDENTVNTLLGNDTDAKKSSQLKNGNYYANFEVLDNGTLVLQSKDMTKYTTDQTLKIVSLGSWDTSGNYTAGGNYNAAGHNISNVGTLGATNINAGSINLGGQDLATTLNTTNETVSNVITQVNTLTSNVVDITNMQNQAIKSNSEAIVDVKNMAQNGIDQANREIHTNADAIANNADAISKNSEAIAQNSADIATNAANIQKNADAIATETAAREELAQDVENRTNTLVSAIKDNSEKIVQNAKNMEALQNNLGTVQQMAQNGLDDLNKKVDTNTGNIAQNKADIAANKALIEQETAVRQAEDAKLKSQIAKETDERKLAVQKINEELATKATKEELTNATTQMATQLGSAIQGVQQQVTSQGTQIQGLTQDVAALQSKDTELQGNIDAEKTAREAKDAELEKSIQVNAGNISKNAADIAENKVQIANNKAAITDNKNAIEKNAAAIEKETNERKADVSALSDRISSNDAFISSLNRQLQDVNKEVDTVGALSMAMAGLHPLEYDENGANFQLAAAVGNYDGTQALALGGFYHFNRDSMISLGLATDLGADTHKFGANLGYTIRVGHGSETRRPSEGTVSDILKDIQELKAKQAQLEKENEALKAQLAALAK